MQGKSQKDSRQVLVCLPFVDRNTILPIADDVFILKVPNKQGILLFVHQMLTRESYVLGTCSGSVFEILLV